MSALVQTEPDARPERPPALADGPDALVLDDTPWPFTQAETPPPARPPARP